MRPEPFYGTNVEPSVDSINNVNTNDEDYNNSEALFAETPTNGPPKRRPPAPFTVGKPQRPLSMNNNLKLNLQLE